MGRIRQKAVLKNTGDVLSEKVDIRTVDVNFLVDSGVAMICLPPSLIAKLGLKLIEKANTLTASGRATKNIYSAVDIHLDERYATFNVMETPEEVPPLLGYIPLEQLDYVIDMRQHKLIPNPEHDGELLLDLL